MRARALSKVQPELGHVHHHSRFVRVLPRPGRQLPVDVHVVTLKQHARLHEGLRATGEEGARQVDDAAGAGRASLWGWGAGLGRPTGGRLPDGPGRLATGRHLPGGQCFLLLFLIHVYRSFGLHICYLFQIYSLSLTFIFLCMHSLYLFSWHTFGNLSIGFELHRLK